MMGFITKKEYDKRSSPVTICKYCKFHINKSKKGMGLWYDHYCNAEKRDKILNLVSGEWEIIEKLPHCRSINNGNCKFYKRK